MASFQGVCAKEEGLRSKKEVVEVRRDFRRQQRLGRLTDGPVVVIGNGRRGGEHEGWGCMRWARGVRESTALAPTSCPGPLCTRASLVAKSCLTLGDSMDCSLPGLSVHGIIPARILEWLATSSLRGSFQPGDQTRISCIGR